VRENDIIPNPLIHTLVLDSLCNSLESSVLDAVGRLYHGTLVVFAHMASFWSFCPYDNLVDVPQMFSRFVRQCQKLECIITEQEIPGTALLLMAANAQLSRICVQEGKINLPDNKFYEFPNAEYEQVNWWDCITSDMDTRSRIMTKFMGKAWRPLSRPKFVEASSTILGYRCKHNAAPTSENP
jgi:hypothetical protein